MFEIEVSRVAEERSTLRFHVRVSEGDGSATEHDVTLSRVAKPLRKPEKVLDGTSIGSWAELDLDGDDTAIIAFDDQVRLVVTAVGSEVPDDSVPGLRIHPKRQRD